MNFEDPSRWTKLYQATLTAAQSTAFPNGFEAIPDIDVGGPYDYPFLAAKGLIPDARKTWDLAGNLILTTEFFPDATNVLELLERPILINRLRLIEVKHQPYSLVLTIPYWIEKGTYTIWGFSE